MKRTTAIILLLVLSLPLAAFEIGAYYNVSNLDYRNNRASSATGLPGTEYPMGVRVTGRDELSEGLALDLTYNYDPILRSIAYTRLSYIDDYFAITFGPFFGVLNSTGNFVQSGISTTVELFLPGIAFARLRSDNSLSGRLIVAGDYIQEQSELAIGFYAPNVIPTVYVNSKRYTSKTDAGENVDTLNEYGVRTDIFQKAIPYRVNLNFAYQTAGRQFIETTTTTQTYGSVVLGIRLDLTLFELLTFTADLDSSIYTFGLEDLVGEVSADSFLFRLTTGLSIDTSVFQ